MLLKYFYNESLAHASYMLGCQATGQAMVIDPARDIQPYLEIAANEDLKITHVTETHIHADYVSGSRELARATGADLYLSDTGTPEWKYTFKEDTFIPLHDGQQVMIGNLCVEILHTPGHTPESISLMVTDTLGADKPMGIFTGDFLFVGDVGRPDLLEEAVGIVGSKEAGAKQQFQSIERFRELPDYLQIWPAHGAGSACGKALGAVPSSTLGYEKLFNPAFQFDEEGKFVEWLLSDQPEAPVYFAQMKQVNKQGPALLAELEEPAQQTYSAIEQLLTMEAVIIDMRDREAFAAGHLPGTINIPASSRSFINYVGWFVDYEQPFYFIAPDEASVPRITKELRSIGVDDTPGYFLPTVIKGDLESYQTVSAEEVREQYQGHDAVILDVRGQSEFADEHVTGAVNIPLGWLPRRLKEIPDDKSVVVHCASGYRSGIATSVLQRYGFENVINLDESFENIARALPIESR